VISPDDAELAARDPSLPGLATVFDGAAMEGALRAALPGRKLGAVHPRYARWKPGHSAVVAYELELDGGELWAYARAHTRRRFAGLEKRLSTDEEAPGPFGPGVVPLAGPAVAVRAFSGDRRLRSLRLLADEGARGSLLAQVAPGRPELSRARLEPLRYWPERRFVARLGGAGEPVLLKAYAEQLYPRAARAGTALTSGEALRLARALGSSDRHGVLAFEWLHGHPLTEALVEPKHDSGLPAAVAAALAELHRRPGSSLLLEDPREHGRLLERRAAWIGRVCDDVAAPARGLAGRLAAELAAGPPGQVAVHGDFSPKQVLVAAESVSIIDLDDACRGHPELDLGTFLADLEARVVAGGLTRARADAVAAALLDEYRRRAGPVDAARLRTCLAAGLLGRAASGFRNRTLGWRSHLPGLVQRAERILDQGLE
jgi:hypothetical protein